MKQIIVLSALLALAFGYFDPQPPRLQIFNGKNATASQFPWNVLIKSTNATGTEVICGGSIISVNWVVTSAQCVVGFVIFNLQFGTMNNNTKTLFSVHSVVHPNYVSSKLLNDIALIQLPENLTFSSTISPISLPPLSEFNTTYLNMFGSVSGFGINGILKYAIVRIISNLECSRVYGTGYITDTKLCTVGFNMIPQGACNGDSGAPLILVKNKINILVGVVSFTSSRGCASGDPTGYTRTSKYVKWIEYQTGIFARA